MLYLGILIGIGAAVTFILIGALTLFGGVDATQRQLLPGFVSDQSNAGLRLLTMLIVWLPIVVVSVFCLLTGIQIVRVVIAALM
jgi:hypothetical protein